MMLSPENQHETWRVSIFYCLPKCHAAARVLPEAMSAKISILKIFGKDDQTCTSNNKAWIDLLLQTVFQPSSFYQISLCTKRLVIGGILVDNERLVIMENWFARSIVSKMLLLLTFQGLAWATLTLSTTYGKKPMSLSHILYYDRVQLCQDPFATTTT